MEGRRGWFEAYLVILWLSDTCSFVSVFSVDAGTVALKLGVIYEEHLGAVALTGCACLILHLTCNRWLIQYGATAVVGKLFSDVGTPRVSFVLPSS